jgi:hypothetical protein
MKQSPIFVGVNLRQNKRYKGTSQAPKEAIFCVRKKKELRVLKQQTAEHSARVLPPAGPKVGLDLGSL